MPDNWQVPSEASPPAAAILGNGLPHRLMLAFTSVRAE